MIKDAHAIPAQIIDTASEWFVIMRDPDVAEAQRTAFADWLRMSPVHVRVYLEIAKLWTDSAHLSASDAPEVGEELASNVIPLQVPHVDRPVRRRSRRAVAASLAASMVLGVLAIWWYLASGQVYVTEVGELRALTLEDGSVVRLNSRSKLKVRFTPELRSVELIKGQALFQVAKDASRPFVVHSDDATVRAVGTQFDVYKKNNGTLVTVVEGKVAVSRAGEAVSTHALPGATTASSNLLVVAGEQVSVAPSGDMQRPAHPNLVAATSWLQHELVFEDRPLQEVLEEFNRYTRVALVLEDPTLADLRINAVFQVTETDSLLKFISRIEGVKVDRTRNEIRISRDPASALLSSPEKK